MTIIFSFVTLTDILEYSCISVLSSFKFSVTNPGSLYFEPNMEVFYLSSYSELNETIQKKIIPKCLNPVIYNPHKLYSIIFLGDTLLHYFFSVTFTLGLNSFKAFIFKECKFYLEFFT